MDKPKHSMEKILSFAKNFKIGKKELFFLFLVFLLGFGIRAQNIQPNYEYFFGFDSYYHARMTSYVIQNGDIPAKDPLAYYQLGYSDLPSTGSFFWYFCALIYKIGTLGAPYNKETWIFFVKVLPALFGALTAVAMYFFGKELYGKKAGYATAIIAAVVPSFVYRTMAGFFEEDSLGFLWMAIGFVFFLRALKEFKFSIKSLLNAFLAGTFFGIMAFTWGFYLIVPVVIAFSFPFMLLNLWGKKEPKEVLAFLGNFAVTAIIFSIFTYFKDGMDWLYKGSAYIINSMPFNFGTSNITAMGIAIIAIFALLIFGIFLFLLFSSKKQKHSKKSNIFRFVSTCLLYVALFLLIIALIDPQFTNPATGKKEGIFTSKFKGQGVLGSTIGEESLGHPTFGYKYNALIIFPIIVLIAMPLWLYYSKKDFFGPLLFWWVWITLVMAWYKLKFTYVFGLPIALSAGFVSMAVFYYFRDKKLLETKIVIVALAFLLLTGIGAGSYFVTKRPPSIETNPDWKNAMHWLKDNTPENAKLFNWWSYGHWLAFVSERQVSVDNRNWSLESDSDYARFIISNDLNEALSIIKSYHSDYVVIEASDLGGQAAMLIYARLNPRYSPVAPENRPYFFTLDFGRGLQFVPGFLQLPCNKTGKNYNCQGLRFSEEQMRSFQTGWHAEPNFTLDSDDVAIIYASPDFSHLWVFSPGSNNSMIARLWMNDPKVLEYFEPVYGNKTVKIFKVKESVFESKG